MNSPQTTPLSHKAQRVERRKRVSSNDSVNISETDIAEGQSSQDSAPSLTPAPRGIVDTVSPKTTAKNKTRLRPDDKGRVQKRGAEAAPPQGLQTPDSEGDRLQSSQPAQSVQAESQLTSVGASTNTSPASPHPSTMQRVRLQLPETDVDVEVACDPEWHTTYVHGIHCVGNGRIEYSNSGSTASLNDALDGIGVATAQRDQIRDICQVFIAKAVESTISQFHPDLVAALEKLDKMYYAEVRGRAKAWAEATFLKESLADAKTLVKQLKDLVRDQNSKIHEQDSQLQSKSRLIAVTTDKLDRLEGQNEALKAAAESRTRSHATEVANQRYVESIATIKELNEEKNTLQTLCNKQREELREARKALADKAGTGRYLRDA